MGECPIYENDVMSIASHVPRQNQNVRGLNFDVRNLRPETKLDYRGPGDGNIPKPHGRPHIPFHPVGHNSANHSNDFNGSESQVDNDFYHTPQHRIEAAFQRTPQSTSPRRTRRKPKVKSLYDEDHYALPDMSSNTSREDSDSTSRDEFFFKSFWTRIYSKRCMLIVLLLCLFLCIGVVVGVVLSSKEKDRKYLKILLVILNIVTQFLLYIIVGILFLLLIKLQFQMGPVL